MLVYQAHNTVSGKFYVGKTTKTLDQRIRQHYNDTNIDRLTHFHKALKKYPAEAFEWIVLDTATTLEGLNRLERHWISLLRECGHVLYNMRDGGDGGSRPGSGNPRFGKSMPGNTRLKISQSLKQYYSVHPNPMQGRTGNGRPHSEEAKRKISHANKGRKRPDLLGSSNPSARAILCLTTGERFETATIAAEKYNSDLSSIIKCCRGTVKSVKGRVYEYA